MLVRESLSGACASTSGFRRQMRRDPESRDPRAPSEWTLDVGAIEKDYVLGWLLAGIEDEPALADTWVFKGGTCRRKCYYETYRFSEDLDFTVINGGPEQPACHSS